MSERLAVAIEGSGKKVFASALEWPGWSRSGKTDEAAIETLLAYAPRYEPVARAAGQPFPSVSDVDVAERLESGSGTEFGVPSRPAAADERPVDATDAKRLARIVEAAWSIFDRIAAGPRPSYARARVAAAAIATRWSATSSAPTGTTPARSGSS